MSTEVESCKVDSVLTAGAEEKNHNKSDGAPLQKPGREEKEQDQRSTEKQQADGHKSEATDMHKKCKENDKENDQSTNADSATETVKRKVVEAPPPKVNPWTKRTTGRVPINTINASTQEKGERFSAVSHYNRLPGAVL